MIALELVHPAPPTAAATSRSTHSTHSTVVLTTALIERLATLNAAARDLRAMGYTIVSESLRMDRSHPEIHIARDERSIAQLLDQGRGHNWKTVGDRRIGHTEFQGVMVCWEEFQR